MAAKNKVCIKDGVVVNIIFADDDFAQLLIQTRQFDKIIDQDNKFVNIGYIDNGSNIIPPPVIPLDPQIAYQIKIQNAMLGFNNIMIQYVASNVLLGITQAGKTKLIADTLADVQRYGQSGSLYAAITALQAIELTPEMDPFLNQKIVDSLVAQTTQVLASL